MRLDRRQLMITAAAAGMVGAAPKSKAVHAAAAPKLSAADAALSKHLEDLAQRLLIRQPELATNLDYRPPHPDDIPPSYPEVDHHPDWTNIDRTRTQHAVTYTAPTMTGWLRTDSLVNTLDHHRRQRFLTDISDIIDQRFTGRIDRSYLYEMITATAN